MDLYTAVSFCEGFEEAASEEDLLEAWQYLIDSGHAWTLQGWFGRRAADLIRSGRCQLPGGSQGAQEAASDA